MPDENKEREDSKVVNLHARGKQFRRSESAVLLNHGQCGRHKGQDH